MADASTTEWTVRRILEWTTSHLKQQGSESPRLDAEVLLAYACGAPRIQLYTRYDEPLDDAVRARMRELVKRRAAAEPVAYLVGFREFFSLKFAVGPGVFIPRPDTETLVVAALDWLRGRPAEAEGAAVAPRVLDLCTGSGCVAIAIAVNHPQAQATAVEFSPQALEFARRNIATHSVEGRVALLQGDLFEPIPPGRRFDVIVSNPPYVAAAEISTLQPDVARHEPHAALDGGPDGLDVIRRIAAGAPEFLAPGGSLLLELSPEQAETVARLLEQSGFANVCTAQDLGGRARVIAASWGGAADRTTGH